MPQLKQKRMLNLCQYDMPLTDWITIGLNAKSLEMVTQAIRENQPLEGLTQARRVNSLYLEKVIREEVVKQFSSNMRPLLEVILNSIDARPTNEAGDYIIRVTPKRRSFRVEDEGTSMGLEDILTLLIIPFATQKSGIDEIGRFGVGFLSTFNYCALQPRSASVIVDTCTDSERYRMVFYSDMERTATGKDNRALSGLRMRVEKLNKGTKTGTTVLVKGDMPYLKELIPYLHESLEGIPAFKAIIMMKGEILNDDPETRWYSSPVEFEVYGKTIKQNVGLRIEPKEDKISLTSQGVFVRCVGSDNGGATIYFPSAVRVPEGRDEFKLDENYHTAVKGVFEALKEYITNQSVSQRFLFWITEFIPNLAAAFDLKKASDIPQIDSIVETLIPGKRYALTRTQFDSLSPFFGKEVMEQAFAVSHSGVNYWREIMGSYSNLIKTAVSEIETYTVEDFKKKLGKDENYLPNLHLLAYIISKKPFYKNIFSTVHLVECKRGESPVMVDQDGEVYINKNHDWVQGELNPAKVYGIMKHFMADTNARRKLEIKDSEIAEAKAIDFHPYLNRRLFKRLG
jgi:hypothetical protein